MSCDWPLVSIDDIKAVSKSAISIGPFGSRMKIDCYVESGVPVIRGTNLSSDPELVGEFVYITEEKADELIGCNVYEGDLVFPHRGAIGEVGIVSGENRYVLSSILMKLTCNRELANPQYIYYFFKSRLGRHELLKNASQVGTPGIGQPLSSLKSIKFRLPPLKIQDAIATSVGQLNSKIALNRRTNHTLEQIAQTLFKSWFVDFDPVRVKVAVRECFEQRAAEHGELLPAPAALEEAQNIAAAATIAGLTFDPADLDGTRALLEAKLADMEAEQRLQLMETAALFPSAFEQTELGNVPAGWGVTTLDEILEFNPRRSLKKGVSAPYLDMKNVPIQGHLAEDVYLRNFGSGTKFINGDTLLARITPCLENGKTAFVDFLDKDQVGWGSTEFIVLRPKGGRPLSLGYLMARLETFRALAIQSMTGTSGRQRADAKSLAATRWLDYPLELLGRFDDIAGAYLRAAKNDGDESKILSQLRDTLLPKLLSGEIQLTPEPLAEAS